MAKNLKLRIKVEFVETEAEPLLAREAQEQVDDFVRNRWSESPEYPITILISRN